MSNAIAKKDNVQEMKYVTDTPNPLAMLGMAIEKGMSVSDLGPLMDLVERDQASKARVAFTAAMSEFQAKCPTIRKTGKGDRYNYAPLDEIIWTIRPVLDECGLSVRFDSETTADTVTAICYVSHKDGHTEKSQFTAPIDRAVSKAGNSLMNSTQQVGSANSYAKRYALGNALNLVGSEFDDDGAGLTASYITEKQVITIRDWVENTDSDEKAFCEWLKVDSLEQIYSKDFNKALNALKQKGKAK